MEENYVSFRSGPRLYLLPPPAGVTAALQTETTKKIGGQQPKKKKMERMRNKETLGEKNT